MSSLLQHFTPNTPQSAETMPEWAKSLRIVRSARAKRTALRVDPAKGDVCLVIPSRTSEARALAFAKKNAEWIINQQKRLPSPVPFAHNQQIPIFGQMRRIQISPSPNRITHISLEADTLLVQTNRENPSNNIRQYLYRLLDETVRPLATQKAEQIGRQITAIDLRDTSSRWGSCGHDGRIMLCWRLVFAPLDVIDYVVAHEVAHLEHMNHSKSFWTLCQTLSANFTAKNWLTQNGNDLLRYGN